MMNFKHVVFAAAAGAMPFAHTATAEAMPQFAQSATHVDYSVQPPTILSAAELCDAQGNYPPEVKALPGFHTSPATGKPNQLDIQI